MSESSTPKDRHPGLATDLLHADDESHGPEVSPSISVTTSLLFLSYHNASSHHISWTAAFRQTESPEFTEQDYLERPELVRGSNTHAYSRLSQSVSTRVEHVLSKINVSTYTLLKILLVQRNIGRLRYHLRIWLGCYIRCTSVEVHCFPGFRSIIITRS